MMLADQQEFTMQMIETGSGRVVEHEGFTKPLPPLAVDAKVHG